MNHHEILIISKYIINEPLPVKKSTEILYPLYIYVLNLTPCIISSDLYNDEYNYIYRRMCYFFAGKAIIVCVTEACCHGNEGRYCWQHKGHHVSQDLHTET